MNNSQNTSGKFIPEDIFTYLREEELSLIKKAKLKLKITNPSKLEVVPLVEDISNLVEQLSELMAKLKSLSVKADIRAHKYELLKGDSSLKKEDRLFSLINEDSQFQDLYLLNQNLTIIIDYISDLIWTMRNLIKFYTGLLESN